MFFKISLEFCVILEKPGGVPTKNGAEIILLEPDPGNAGGGMVEDAKGRSKSCFSSKGHKCLRRDCCCQHRW